MKRIISIIAILMLLLSLVACGGKSNAPANDKSTDGNSSTQGNSENPDNAKDLLARYGLNLDEVKPDEMTDSTFAKDSTSMTASLWLEGIESTDFDKDAYIEKLYGFVLKAADDGKIYEPYALIMGNKDEMELEVGSMIYQWGYIHGGKSITITIGMVSDMKPDSDEDKYIPVVTLAFNE